MESGKLEDWVALGLLPGLGSANVRRAVALFGDPGEVAHRVPVAELQAALGIRDRPASAVAALRPSTVSTCGT